LFVISICLAFSAVYEIFEWIVAAVTGDSAEGFLGTQGYVWDTVRHGNGAAGRNFGSEFVEPTPRPAIGRPRQ
jgi:Predicted membrane protein (DUF2238)